MIRPLHTITMALAVAGAILAMPCGATRAAEPADGAAAPAAPTPPKPATPAAPAAGIRPVDDILKDVSKPAPAPRQMSSEEAAKLRAQLEKATKKLLDEARVFYKHKDWDRCIDSCQEALKRDPACVDAQKLRYEAERARIDQRLVMLGLESAVKDKQALADLDEASNYPDKHHPLARPVDIGKPAPLAPRSSGKTVKTDKMIQMEQRLNQHVGFNMIDVDLEYLLTTMSRTTGVNMIADQDAIKDKRLTLAVQDMPLKEVLRFISRTKGIVYTVTEDAVWISASTGDNPAMEPRIHALNVGIALSSPMQIQQQQQPQPGAGGPGQFQMPPPPNANANANANANGQQQKAYLEEVLDWMKKWKEWPSGTEWSLDKMASSLLVYTTPEMHDKIDEMLETMDRAPIQVLISTRFITITADDLKELGLDFSMQNKYQKGVGVAAGSGTSLIDTSGAGGGLSMIVKGFDTDPLFTATLKALEKKGTGKILSAPQIITLNNQRGHIDISKSFNYISSYTPVLTTETTSNNGGSSTTSQNVTYMVPVPAQMKNTFALDVTPSVGRDLKTIILELQPVITEAEGDITKQFGTMNVLQTSSNAPPPATPQPIMDTRQLTTRLVVNDGDLVIIGGLMGQDTSKAVTKVPLLGDIPLLGYLFRYESESVSKTHLVIVVKAQVINPTGRTYEDRGGGNANGTAAALAGNEGPFLEYPELDDRLPGVGR